MKLLSSSIVQLAFLATLVCGFKDTSVFFSNKRLADFQYITASSELSEAFKGFTEEVCSSAGSRMIVYRVNNLESSEPEQDGTFIKHVHYGSNKMLDLELGASCDGSKVTYYNNYVPSNESPSIAIVDVEDGHRNFINDFLNSTDTHIIVQGKPSFHSPESKVDGIKHFIQDTLYEKLNVDLHGNGQVQKRGTPTEADSEFEKIQQEVEDDFKAAQSLIAENGDSVVTILNGDKDTSVSSDTTTSSNSNLFTKYQFFTAGIWSCLIISAFLLFILYHALAWVSSIEVSYKAFEKQVDHEKKNE